MLFCTLTEKLLQLRTKGFLNVAKTFKNRTKSQESFIKQKVSESPGFNSLAKPFIFTISVTGISFVGASFWQYEEIRKLATNFSSKRPIFNFLESDFKRTDLRRKFHDLWHSQSAGQKVACFIIGINTAVLLSWRIPALYPLMSKYFAASPGLKASCLPMLLSTFSHHSFFHFAANMYVLYSFSSIAVQFYGKEQFVALYLSAGVWSSFASYVYKVASGRLLVSLGASGALMAILSSMCVQFPDARLQIAFLPFFTFTAGNAIKALMAFDTVGLFAKWQFFDHAAHLGGATVGIFYLLYGRQYLWDRREPLMKWYHDIREKRRN